MDVRIGRSLLLLSFVWVAAAAPRAPAAETLDLFKPTNYCDPCAGGSGGHGHDRKGKADKHAPAGLMGEHMHGPGEIMAEYKYMNMYMDDNRIGTRTVSDQQAFAIGNALGTNGAFTPTQMTMEMHMIHLMYGWSEDVTIYTMLMLNSLTMDHVRGGPMFGATPFNGSTFTTHNSGFDDTVFGALIRLYESDTEDLIFNFGFSVPTGDLTRTSTAPRPDGMPVRLPYPMRLGSGTFDFRPAITYRKYFDNSSTGLQFATDLPLGRNHADYSVGNEYRLNWWYAVLPVDWLALSYRLESLWKENYSGGDPTLNPMAISTARTDMRGGEWINFGYGTAVLLPRGHLINFEATHPVYQNLEGIQLETDWAFFISWSKAW